jgi:hypothetical protein
MMKQNDLAARLYKIETMAAVQQLKAQYAAAADAKYRPDCQPVAPEAFAAAAARQAACFSEYAVWDAGEFGGIRHGRAAIHQLFRSSPWRFTSHLYSAPSFGFAENYVTATWRLWELGIHVETGETVLLTGVTEERYVQEGEDWKIAALKFLSLHRVVLSTAVDAVRCLIPEFLP